MAATGTSQWEPAVAALENAPASHHHHHHHHQQLYYHNQLPPPVLNPPEVHYSQAPLHNGSYQTSSSTSIPPLQDHSHHHHSSVSGSSGAGSGRLSHSQPYYGNYTTAAASQSMYQDIQQGYEAATAQAQQKNGAKGSLDFVHKLFTMLEEPGYSSIVRWSNTGDSFVVLDTSDFTKTVLPRHFKHSNFASFVRQLNKYDFHKVRSASGGTENPYGENVWEFKHPEFRIDNRDQLDSIKRKTPMTRRVVVSQTSSQVSADGAAVKKNSVSSIQQGSELATLRAEIDSLRESHKELAARHTQLEVDHRMALDRIAMLQETQRSRDEYLQQIGHFLRSSGYPLTEDSKPTTNNNNTNHYSPPTANNNATNDENNETSNDTTNETYSRRRTSSSATAASVERPPPPPWDAGKAFSVLLVEDDETSVRICLKFLRQYGCDVDVANDGLDAVARAQAAQYDLILMDVVIPSLDGISAAEIIRGNKASSSSASPIIAMAENDSDFKAYFDRGVSGVLTKPFNKDTMYSMLDSFLRSAK
ncbi:hypothetical protein TRVA0_003S00914 [Trichomonascus vanleenenianus]|uniref:kinase-regulated stress-responsive transcription factor SKN7 n=1 Tax=Trichomonascus vanleenenianus TaxID=2268995 RepID=UPI003ECB420E